MVALPPSSGLATLARSAGSVTALVYDWGFWTSKHEPVGDHYSASQKKRAGRSSRRNAIVAFVIELLEPDLRAKHADEVKLHTLGYRQELSRDLTLLNVFGVTVSALSYFWITGLVLPYGMLHGGPVSIVYGWMSTVFFNILVSLSLGELTSAYPTSGALYYMCWAMAPPRMKRFSSYMVAWMNLMSQMSLTVAIEISLTLLVQEFVGLCTAATTGVPNTNFTKGQSFGIYCGVVVSQALLLSGRQAVSSFLFTVAALWHVVPIIALITAMLCLAPSFQPSSWVWASWEPNTEVTGMSSPLLTFLIGAQMGQFIFIGYDAPIHLSEETIRSSIVSPAVVVLSVVATGFFGGAYLLTMLYAVQDPTRTGPDSPATADFLVLTLYGVFQGKYGQGSLCAPIMVIPTVAGFLSCLSSLAVNSRFVYAISRDGAFPFSAALATLHEGTKVPLAALWACVAIVLAIGALGLTAPVTMYTLFNVNVNAATLVLTVTLTFRACHSFSCDTFLPGPFHLGRLGAPLAAVGAAYMLYVTIIFAFPTFLPVEVASMNYSGVLLVAMFLLTLASWYFPRYGARHWFNGPKATLGAGLKSASGTAPAAESAPWQAAHQNGGSWKDQTVLQRIGSSLSLSFLQTRMQELELLELKEQQMYRWRRPEAAYSNRSLHGSAIFNGQVKMELAAEQAAEQLQPVARVIHSRDEMANDSILDARPSSAQ